MGKAAASNEKMERSQCRHSDMITNLPESVIEMILTKLATPEAVRTSALSRKWRYKWAELSEFIFDDSLWSVLERGDSAETFTRVMYQFMSIHKGPILKFILSYTQLDLCPGIDNLIVFLSRNGIVDLTIEMWRDDYTLPSAIFTCQNLKHLNISTCNINISKPVFQGFRKLTSLKLTRCRITAVALRILISESPSLEQLELTFGYCIALYIDAPNLRTFSFDGVTKSIILNRPLLASLSIHLYAPCWNKVSFLKFIQAVPALETLCLNYHMVKSFVVIDPERRPTTLVNLKHLNLDYSTSFNEIAALQFTLVIMRCSPNLRSVEIQFDDHQILESTTLYLEGEDYSDIWMSELREVTLEDVSGTNPELEFIKLLLAKSPTLRTLKIKPGRSVHNACEMLTEVIKFQRASTEAQVLYGR